MATATRKPSRGAAFYRGEAGMRKGDEELARQKAQQEARKEQGNIPFRFRVTVGETTQFVVCDDAPDFFRFEHNLKNPRTGHWDTFTGCVKEWDNCPVCQVAERESYYAMYLTVVDFTPFETKDGTNHEFSRKLLVVKPAQQKKFQRAYIKAQKDGRTLRGAIFEATRDGDKDSAIGNDIEFIEYMDEEELTGYVRSWKDKEGKKHTEQCSEPLDYEALFAEPDTESLRLQVGGTPAPGNRAHEDRELGRRPRRGAKTEEDEEYEPAERTQRMSSTPRRGRAAPEEEAEDEPAPTRGRTAGRRPAREEPEDEPAPVRGRTAGRRPAPVEEAEDEPAPLRRGAATRRAPVEEPPFDDDPEDEAPPARGKAPGVGRRPIARGR